MAPLTTRMCVLAFGLAVTFLVAAQLFTTTVAQAPRVLKEQKQQQQPPQPPATYGGAALYPTVTPSSAAAAPEPSDSYPTTQPALLPSTSTTLLSSSSSSSSSPPPTSSTAAPSPPTKGQQFMRVPGHEFWLQHLDSSDYGVTLDEATEQVIVERIRAKWANVDKYADEFELSVPPSPPLPAAEAEEEEDAAGSGSEGELRTARERSRRSRRRQQQQQPQQPAAYNVTYYSEGGFHVSDFFSSPDQPTRSHILAVLMDYRRQWGSPGRFVVDLLWNQLTGTEEFTRAADQPMGNLTLVIKKPGGAPRGG